MPAASRLEIFPNELFLVLFEYCPAMDLFRAFDQLNNRFHRLLFHAFRSYSLNFRCLSRTDLKLLHDRYLPLINERTVALNLSNDNETSYQLPLMEIEEQIFSRLNYLQSLVLSNIFDLHLVQTIGHHLDGFPRLLRLRLIKCIFPSDSIDMLDFINHIWNLPKLILCALEISIENDGQFLAPISTCATMKSFSLKGVRMNVEELPSLFEHTPNLTRFQLHNYCIESSEEFSLPVSSLEIFDLAVLTSNSTIVYNILENLSNLSRLIIEVHGLDIDGYQWENLIRQSLIHLKTFRLRQQFPLENVDEADDKLNNLIASFQTPFWLEERRWYIRADWTLTDQCSYISLYTLPYSFKDFTYDFLLSSGSTLPSSQSVPPYSRVEQFYYNHLTLDDLVLVDRRFPHLSSLQIRSSIDRRLFAVLPRLSQLSTLSICSSDLVEANMTDPAMVTDEPIRLDSLQIHSSSLTLVSFFLEQRNLFVRRLDLQENAAYFNSDLCSLLCQSSLTERCQVLTVDVLSCSDVLCLIRERPQLQKLRIRCDDDNYDSDALSGGDDDFLHWLQVCLPAFVIGRDAIFQDNVHIKAAPESNERHVQSLHT